MTETNAGPIAHEKPKSDSLLTDLHNWRSFHAIVVGDFMLDELIYGDAEKLSADAPVPVLRVSKTERRPGGAANVCLDLAALGGRVEAVGFIGKDPDGKTLIEAIDDAVDALKTQTQRAGRVTTTSLIADPSRPTTVKRNLIGLAQARHPQKMFRLDHESREPASVSQREHLFQAFDDALARALSKTSPDRLIVCIEDYAKGVCDKRLCRHVIDRSKAAGVRVIVDPALNADYAKYSGATTVTPNRTEAEKATGLKSSADGTAGEDNAKIARQLLETINLDAVVLTLDRDGALFLAKGQRAPTPVPTHARSVYDVTGAGDMLFAALGAALANGLGWINAVRFANAAAGLEVEVFGVVPIPFERVHAEALKRNRLAQGGGAARDLDDLLVELAPLRSEGRTVVFTNGCFDLLHAGHVHLLEKAKEKGDFLIVAINSDESVRRLKGHLPGPPRPVTGQDDRARVLAAMRSVDAVVIFDEDTPESLLASIKPDVLVKGGDYKPDEVVGREIVEANGGRVEQVSELPGLSTSKTLEKIGNN